MKVKDLIEMLSHTDQDYVVEIYDLDAEDYLPVSGAEYGGGMRWVRFCCDTDKKEEADHAS